MGTQAARHMSKGAIIGLIECASGTSCWRGYDYYLEGRVIDCVDLGQGQFEGRVDGNAEEPYEVRINIEHPRFSSCNCPHAKDRRIVCKHQIALYFEAEPGAAEFFIENQRRLEEEYNEEMKLWWEEHIRMVEERVDKMSFSEMRQKLINMLVEQEEWR